MSLLEKRCVPCDGGVPKLEGEAALQMLEECPEWRIEDDWILRDFTLKGFKAVIDLVRDIADLAEDEGHHPDLLIHGYKHLQIRLQTHVIDGLSENDFILAAKIDRIWKQHA